MQPNSSERSGEERREFHYTRRDFDRVRKLIYARAGISLAESKFNMVYSRLARRLRALSLDAVGAYLDELEEHGGPDEWQEFTNALTTNLTAFFREAHHFDVLRRYLADVPRSQPVRIWCAASSTGEEPYSIAITVREHYGPSPAPVRILATDVDTQVLATAEAGIYPLERIAKMPDKLRHRYFRRGTGRNEGFCRVVDELRELLIFRPLNLLDEQWPLRGPLDVIFCRNVMIYFDKATQRRILEKFRPLLRPDGLLLAGHSESFLHAADLFRSCGRTVYRRADVAGIAA